MMNFCFFLNAAVVAAMTMHLVYLTSAAADTVDEICIVLEEIGSGSIQNLDYSESEERWYADDVMVNVSNNTWVVYELDDNEVIYICECVSLPADYFPSVESPGNPSDCQEWSDSSIIVSDNSGDCVGWDTDLNFIDISFLGYAFLIVLLIVLHYLPCAPERLRGKCNKDTYEATTLATYSAMMKRDGLDVLQTRSAQDTRTVDVALLKSDLLKNKVVWHDNVWIDYYFHLRISHPMLSLCCGHPLHAFNRKERWVAMAGTQFAALGIAAFVTWLLALFNIDTSIYSFLIGFTVDLVFGTLVSSMAALYGWFAICKLGETKTDAECRGCCKNIGGCCMGVVTVVFFCVGCFGIVLALVAVLSLYSTDDSSSILFIFAVNYVTGVIFSWFLIDLFGMTVDFIIQYYRQKGEMLPQQNKYLMTFLVVCPCSCCCFLSWYCLFCGCYYWMRYKGIKKGQNELLSTINNNKRDDGDSKDKYNFALTWQEYKTYKNTNSVELTIKSKEEWCNVLKDNNITDQDQVDKIMANYQIPATI